MEDHFKVDMDYKDKLLKYKGDLAKRRTIIETLLTEKTNLLEKLQEADFKSKEFVAKDLELWKSMEKALTNQKKLEDGLSMLQDGFGRNL